MWPSSQFALLGFGNLGKVKSKTESQLDERPCNRNGASSLSKTDKTTLWEIPLFFSLINEESCSGYLAGLPAPASFKLISYSEG